MAKQIVTIVFNETATSALALNMMQIRIAPFGKTRQACFVFRKKVKTAPGLYGFGTAFAVVDGKASVAVPLETYLERMENVRPAEGTHCLKAKSVNDSTYIISGPATPVKDGKKQLVNEAFQVTIGILAVDETPVPVLPAVVEEFVAPEPTEEELQAQLKAWGEQEEARAAAEDAAREDVEIDFDAIDESAAIRASEEIEATIDLEGDEEPVAEAVRVDENDIIDRIVANAEPKIQPRALDGEQVGEDADQGAVEELLIGVGEVPVEVEPETIPVEEAPEAQVAEAPAPAAKKGRRNRK